MKALPWVIGSGVVVAVGVAYWSVIEKKPKEVKTDLQKDMEKAAAEAKAKEPKKSLWQKTKSVRLFATPEEKLEKAKAKVAKLEKGIEAKAAAAVLAAALPLAADPVITIEPVTTVVSVDPQTHEVTVTSADPAAEETKVSETPVTES